MNYLLGILAPLFLTSQAAVDVESAIVGIYAEQGPSSELGTGFFVSPTGHLLTCYHVIAGADRITIYNGAERFEDVVIDQWAPELDVALLKIQNLPGDTPFLSFAKEIPNTRELHEREILGYNHGGSLHRYPFSLPRRGLVGGPFDRSGAIRTIDGQRLFRRDRITLLPVATTLYKGMSGGPVVSNEGVLGIISVAFSEGGTLGWAMPRATYADQLKTVGKRAGEIEHWPRQTMLRSGWSHYLRSFTVNEKASAQTRKFEVEIRNLVGVYDRIRAFAGSARTSSKDALRIFATSHARQSNGCWNLNATARYTDSLDHIRTEIRPLADAYSERGQVHRRLRVAAQGLYEEVRAHRDRFTMERERAKSILANGDSILAKEHARLALNEAALELISALSDLNSAAARIAATTGSGSRCDEHAENLLAAHQSVQHVDSALTYLVSRSVTEQQVREIEKYRALAAASEIAIYRD